MRKAAFNTAGWILGLLLAGSAFATELKCAGNTKCTSHCNKGSSSESANKCPNYYTVEGACSDGEQGTPCTTCSWEQGGTTAVGDGDCHKKGMESHLQY